MCSLQSCNTSKKISVPVSLKKERKKNPAIGWRVCRTATSLPLLFRHVSSCSECLDQKSSPSLSLPPRQSHTSHTVFGHAVLAIEPCALLARQCEGLVLFNSSDRASRPRNDITQAARLVNHAAGAAVIPNPPGLSAMMRPKKTQTGTLV